MGSLIVLFFVFFITTNLLLFCFYKTSKLLYSLILIGILPYIYCLIFNKPLGLDLPYTLQFNLRFLKYIIVNIPGLYLIYYIKNFSSLKNKQAGSLFLGLAFFTNILWTLSYGFGETLNRQLISVMALLLLAVLLLRLKISRQQKKLEFEMKGKHLYSHLICWNYVIAYTTWNILFVDSQFGLYELRLWHNLLPFVALFVLKVRDKKLKMYDLAKIYLAIRALALGLWMSLYSFYQVMSKPLFSSQNTFDQFTLTTPLSFFVVFLLLALLIKEAKILFQPKISASYNENIKSRKAT